MNPNAFWPLDPVELTSILQLEQEIEIAQARRMREWEASLAGLDRRARYRAHNRGLLRHKQAMDRARMLNAIPAWFTDEDEQAILHLHRKAAEREFWSGEPHEVHHTTPLHGECPETGEHVVCGLHLPENLKVVTRAENRRYGAIFSTDWPVARPNYFGPTDDDSIPF